jgi:hypothetical protein
MPKAAKKDKLQFGQGRVVKNKADFDQFLDWLEHSGKAEARKTSYLEFALRDGQALEDLLEEKGPDRYLELAKAGVILEASGDYVADLLKNANQNSRAGLGCEDDSELNGYRREVSSAKAQLASFYATCAREIFKAQMHAASMSSEAVDALIENFEDGWALDPLQAILQGARDAQAGEGKRLSDAFRAFVEHPSRRAALLSPGDEPSLMSRAELDRLGEFAPLIQFLNESLAPSERAEMMARMMAYVDSGWAQTDLVEGVSREELVKDSPWTSHKGLDEWRSVVADLKENASVDKARLLNAFARRFSEVSLTAVVEGGRVDDPVVKSAQLLSDTVGSFHELTRLAPSKTVDVCVISRGARHMHLYSATSDAKMMTQGTQWERYLTAFENEIARDVLTGGCRIGDISLPCKPEVSMTSIAPCLVQRGFDTQYKQAGETIFKEMTVKPSAQSESRMVDLLNAIPLFETILESFESRGSIQKLKSRLVGAGSPVWDGIQASLVNSENPFSDALHAMAESGAELMDLFERHGYSAQVEIQGFGKTIAKRVNDRPAAFLYYLTSILSTHASEMAGNKVKPSKRSVKVFEGYKGHFVKFKDMVAARGDKAAQRASMMQDPFLNVISGWLSMAPAKAASKAAKGGFKTSKEAKNESAKPKRKIK